MGCRNPEFDGLRLSEGQKGLNSGFLPVFRGVQENLNTTNRACLAA